MTDITPPLPPLPSGTPIQLIEFFEQGLEKVALLRRNGAEHAAMAQEAVLTDFREYWVSWLDDFVTVKEAAEIRGCSEETIRRWIGSEKLTSIQSGERGHHKICRGDLFRLDGRGGDGYDPDADAQDNAAQGRLK